jgi:hypothetical protein
VPFRDPSKNRQYQRLWAERRRRELGARPRRQGEDKAKVAARKKRWKRAHPEKVIEWKRVFYSKKNYADFWEAHRASLKLTKEIKNG